MSTIIRFPVERSPGCKVAQIAELLSFMLRAKRINDAVENLDKVASFRRQVRPAQFRRDQVRPAR